MKLVLLVFCFAITSLSSYAQKYAYSFEGSLTTIQVQELESEILQLKSVASCKIKLKDETKGEIFLELAPSPARAESEEGFSPTDIKRMLISKDLMPLNFIELK